MRQAIALYRGKPWQWAVQLGDWLAEAGDKAGALAAYRSGLGFTSIIAEETSLDFVFLGSHGLPSEGSRKESTTTSHPGKAIV